jgi:RND family efflux transporter MFP subunit
MKLEGRKAYIVAVLLIGAVSTLAWIIFSQFQNRFARTNSAKSSKPIPVEVVEIRHGPISLRRTFNGELEALAEFVVSPKVSGRVERMTVNIADTVEQGQVVAELDDDEYEQTIAQAKADLIEARAKLSEARSALQIANREFKRTESLLKRGVTSNSEFDKARQAQLTRQAQFEVAVAQFAKAESSLEIANIRIGYTKVTADWSGGGEHRVIAERYVDEGQTVAANTPLLLIVELHPIIGVFFVTEKDYAHLKPKQLVTLTTDAYPDEQFKGRIDRIAPVFRKSTRQARVEMTIDNPQHKLKPGMFIRATVELAMVSKATIVPELALTRRDDQNGVFVVSKDGRSVVWREVSAGIREGGWVQVKGDNLAGRVVILGQHMIGDGSPITIPAVRDMADRVKKKVEHQ